MHLWTRLPSRWVPLLSAAVVIAGVTWSAAQPTLRFRLSDPWVPAVAPTTEGSLNSLLESRWRRMGIEPATGADDLQVLRRLSIALVGTAPSLEEIRQFESDSSPDRLHKWTERLIADWRFVEFFGERLAASLVNNVGSGFHDKHRQRFVEWLGRSIQHGSPYNDMVRDMITGRGFWADDGAALFIESELSQGELAPQRLAARTARCFLGQRIDCAQCHDHPFAQWKQSDFEGLAAHFAGVRFGALGIQDGRSAGLVIDDQRTQQTRTVEPSVPFDKDRLSARGSERERLAQWVVHPENRRFRRAIVNRIWGLLFGRPLVRPVDDIPDPTSIADAEGRDAADEENPVGGLTDVLDALGDDWAAHGYDVRWLIHQIAASRVFRFESAHPSLESGGAPEATERLADSWAAFPTTQLTAAQLMRSLQQAASLKTIRVREESTTYSYMWNRERIRQAAEQYGECGDMNESHQAGSIPQAVQRLVGPAVRRAADVTIQSAAGRIAAIATDDSDCVDACYLVCLTRRPDADERAYFVDQLGSSRGRARNRVIEDTFWALLNSPEFSWNH
jgi:hypothetical protein